MSFSTHVKNEILSCEITDECCLHAFAYGMLLFSRAFSFFDVSLLTEQEAIAEKYEQILKSVCKVSPEVNKSDAGKIKVEVVTAADREKVMDTFGYDKKSKISSIKLSQSFP